MNRASIASVIVALVIGLAFGSVAFPQIKTLTTTQVSTTTQVATSRTTLESTITTTSLTTLTTTLLSTQTVSTTISGTVSVTTVTFTRVTVLVDRVTGTCTTVSGTRVVTYQYASPGETTTVVNVSPSSLPESFLVTVVTASTLSHSNQTQPFAGSC